MRFLHTADWHLGRSFHGESLLDAQAAAVEHVVAVAREERVDAVLVAGDLYDRALPPVDAVRLADEALRRLSELCSVVVISGNHDSAARLGFGSALLDRAGVHVRTAPSACGVPVEIGGACVYALPYLEPDLVRADLGCDAPAGHGDVVAAAMGRVREDLAHRPPGTLPVVVAHAFVAGAEPSGSERDLTVGGSAVVAPAVFSGAAYVALGHLHGPQRVGFNARYAGSPVAFSFAEAGHRKSIAVVEVAAGEAPRVSTVEVPVRRRLAVLRGTLPSLLGDPALEVHERSWVHATLTDAVRPQDAMERLRRRFEHCVVLEFAPAPGEDGVATAAASYAARMRGLDDGRLLERFVSDVRGAPPAAAEAALLEEALTAGRVAELSA